MYVLCSILLILCLMSAIHMCTSSESNYHLAEGVKNTIEVIL